MNTTSLQNSQIDRAIEIWTNAFDNDPMFRYVMPQEEEARLNTVRWLFRLFFDYVSAYNHIYTTKGDLKGVIAWMPPEADKDNIFTLSEEEEAEFNSKLGAKQAERIVALFSTLEKRHKIDMLQSHWYLYLLGVSSAYQGQKVGSSLIKPILKQADKDGFGCYVVTFTERAIRFYQKHGFKVAWMGHSSTQSPLIWTLRREPNWHSQTLI